MRDAPHFRLPQFKKKYRFDGFRFPQGFKLDRENDRLFLPKLGSIRLRNSAKRRQVPGTVKNVTVSVAAGKWFVSIQIERAVDIALHSADAAVGIDVGIARFATLSDGSFVAPLNSFKKHEVALGKAQRCMSRKRKFSRNWNKAKARIERIQSRIGNCRRDFLHKTSTTISKNHAMVVVENLQIGNMSKSAAGTAAQPGRHVKPKSGLNKAILDQGWGEFRRQLDYKTTWAGGVMLAVPPHHTSITCPCCGHIAKDNRRTQAKFACLKCGYEGHADVVGAMNILSRGMSMWRDEGQDTADASAGWGLKDPTARIACAVNGSVTPSAAGTRRRDSTEVTWEAQ